MWRVDQARSDGELALPRHRKPVAVRRPVLSGGFPIGCGHREHGAHAADGGGHFTTSEGTSRSRSVFHDLAGDITTGVGVPTCCGIAERASKTKLTHHFHSPTQVLIFESLFIRKALLKLALSA